MKIISTQILFRLSFGLLLYIALSVLTTPLALGQDASSGQTSTQAATSTAEVTGEAMARNETAKEAKPALLPVFKEYRGVEIGMTADEVRTKLNNYLKSKNDSEDLFMVNGEVATVYYADGKVTALSVDFPAKSAKAPSAKDVLGQEVQAKTDGSMYSLVRYPEAGYWVAYSRTSGDAPLVTVTLQKMR